MPVKKSLHSPLRSCVVCRVPEPKTSLVRVTRGAGADAIVDYCQNLPGRGAYLCFKHSHWDKALRGGRLAAALRVGSLHNSWQQILQDLARNN